MTADPMEDVAADGTIVTGAARHHVPPPFEPVLRSAGDALPPQVALYVYGSVATGRARIADSDIDLLTVGLPADDAAALSARLSARFASLCRAVEIAPATWAGLGGADDEAHGFRVFLRHHCVHVAGPDPAARLPAFPADAAAARGCHGDLGRCLDAWWSALAAGDDPAVVARRAARKTLLTVAGLVSVVDGTWTTDRVGAARRWSALRPAAAADMAALTDAMRAPPVEAADVEALLGGPVARLAAAFADEIGMWRGSPGRT